MASAVVGNRADESGIDRGPSLSPLGRRILEGRQSLGCSVSVQGLLALLLKYTCSA